jgi:uncharacterized membrane protein
MAVTDQTPAKPPRIALVDMARGLALLGVIFYHFCWDLRYFEFIAVDISFSPGWFYFARSLLASFLFLAGVSLVLAHGQGVRWRAFWRRWGVLVAAALTVTAGTRYLFPDAFVYFGVLHAIALFSLMALPFVFVPFWVSLVLGVVWIAIPLFYAADFFNVWYWSWIGFWTYPPLTQDLVPIFPGFGFTLLGVGLMQLALRNGLAARMAKVSGTGRLGRSLSFLGRWSLIIYLVHQPIMLGALTPIADYVQRQTPAERAAEFSGGCFASCLDVRGNATQCRAYCACALEQVEQGDLWDIIGLSAPNVAQSQSIDAVVGLCNAMADTAQ